MAEGFPITIDRRYHDAMLFNLDCVLAGHAGRTHNAEAVPTTVIALLRELRDLGVGTGAYSTSSDCAELLRTTGLSDWFSVHADGILVAAPGEAGAPNPGPLLEVARQLGARPERCVVVDDTCTTIAAARAGGFAMIVGTARFDHTAEQLAAGADVVAGDLADLELRTGDQRVSALPHALRSIAQIESVLRGRSPAFFLDFDGTVSDIVDDPAAATLTNGVAHALTALSGVCPVAIVSGRALSDIRSRVGLPGLWYAGTHGTELLGPDGQMYRHPIADDSVSLLRKATEDLAAVLESIHGVAIEDKQLSVAVHFRMAAPERVPDVLAAVQSAGRRHNLQVTHGRKVIELHPRGKWDKGDAVNWIIDHLDAPNAICRFTWATTSPTKMPSKPSNTTASGSSSGTTRTTIGAAQQISLSILLTRQAFC